MKIAHQLMYATLEIALMPAERMTVEIMLFAPQASIELLVPVHQASLAIRMLHAIQVSVLLGNIMNIY